MKLIRGILLTLTLAVALFAFAAQNPDTSSANIEAILANNPQLMASIANAPPAADAVNNLPAAAQPAPEPALPSAMSTNVITTSTPISSVSSAATAVLPTTTTTTTTTNASAPPKSAQFSLSNTPPAEVPPSPLPHQPPAPASPQSITSAGAQAPAEDAMLEMSNTAFKNVLQEAFPLTPDQIKQLRNTMDDTQRATAAEAYDAPPQPTSSSMVVSLAPGSTPPAIRLARGFVSSLVFIDSTGAPWPIQAYDLGNPTAFDIKWNQKDNTLMVQARSAYTYGNLAVVLEKMDTPVMLTLIPGQKVVDYRVDLRIQGLGPNAAPMVQGVGMPDQANPVLLSVLDGVAPKGARKLNVEGSSAEAWVLNDKLFVRTRFNVLSPAWMAKMSSADGMNAYEMPKTPMMLVSRYGKPIQLKIEGF